jgi:subtilisin-like proprotein convertase family protein
MKSYLFIGVLTLGSVMSSQAGVIYSTGNVNGSGTSLNTVIPDGSISGVSSAINVGGALGTLSDITVTLNVSGGNNGDLYAYLSYNGTLVTLLNRVGVGSGDAFGSADAGFNNVTLASTGSDVHWASAGGGALSGSYLADGRQISPLSSPASFDADGTVTLDGGFGGLNPNGTWTLFFADLSGGDTSTLQGWSMDITAVPEPVNVALAIFGGILAAWSASRRIKAVAQSTTLIEA